MFEPNESASYMKSSKLRGLSLGFFRLKLLFSAKKNFWNLLRIWTGGLSEVWLEQRQRPVAPSKEAGSISHTMWLELWVEASSQRASSTSRSIVSMNNDHYILHIRKSALVTIALWRSCSRSSPCANLTSFLHLVLMSVSQNGLHTKPSSEEACKIQLPIVSVCALFCQHQLVTQFRRIDHSWYWNKGKLVKSSVRVDSIAILW